MAFISNKRSCLAPGMSLNSFFVVVVGTFVGAASRADMVDALGNMPNIKEVLIYIISLIFLVKFFPVV